jgi:hypothetical protein
MLLSRRQDKRMMREPDLEIGYSESAIMHEA